MREYAVSDADTREREIVAADSPMKAARLFAERHPGAGDLFVSEDIEPPGAQGAWQDLKVFPRELL